MSEANGKLLTCDRCGETVFLRLTGRTELDGGWTNYDNFESAPDGWELAHLPNTKYCRLCPRCFKEYTELLTEFYRNVPERSQR